MSKEFTPLKSNCPICNGQKRGKGRGGRECKQNSSGLIFCITGKELSTLPPGWKQVGETKDGLFGLFSDRDIAAASEEKREEYRRELKANRLRLEAEEAKRKHESLSSEERNTEITKLINQLSLAECDRADLKRRGLSDEQIKLGQFVSVEPWQKLEFSVSPRLAGVDVTGRSLCNPQAAYLCPMRDELGLLIGWQLRLRGATKDKYRWPKSQSKRRPKGPTIHQKNGELPLAVCLPPRVTADHIGFSEGGLKTFTASNLGGIPTIGASGGQWAGSPESLRAGVEAMAAKVGTKKCLLYPDAGAAKNPHMMRNYRALRNILKSLGYTLDVAWWFQVEKTDLDIDDLLAAGKGDLIVRLTWENFEAIANESQGYSFRDLFSGMERMMRLIGKEAKKFRGWGFCSKKEDIDNLIKDKAPLPKIEYQSGKRLVFWKEAAVSKFKYIADFSEAGTGKSYDTGRINPQEMGFERCIYVSAEHRNPSTPTLQNWDDLEARHSGLVKDTFGKWRRTKEGESYSIAPNCDRTKVLGALRAKNVKGADTANLLCPTCPQFEDCREGKRFGFLNQRTATLKADRFRCHPDSLPAVDKFNYAATEKDKGALLVWDEWNEILKFCKDYKVDAVDCAATFMRLGQALHENYGLRIGGAIPILFKLADALSGEKSTVEIGRFGADDAKVREWLLSGDGSFGILW